MIRIEPAAWTAMTAHLEAAWPKEGCGILLGKEQDGSRVVSEAVPCRNAYEGEQADRFQLDPKEQIAADRRARELGLDVLGFFHSHPDCDAYFSATDRSRNTGRALATLASAERSSLISYSASAQFASWPASQSLVWRGWTMHKLWGLLPLFPRRVALCAEHLHER